MRTLFADTFYWIAVVNRQDRWHPAATRRRQEIIEFPILTTDEVLVELLNYFSDWGPQARAATSKGVKAILSDPRVTVVEQTRDSFLSGLSMYADRRDKGYSLTDCISMMTMRVAGLTEILTNDCHFAQEGFTILFGDEA